MDRELLRTDLARMVEEATGKIPEDLGDDQDLREGLGLDSVDLFSLVIEMQTNHQIKINSDDLGQVKTVGDVLDLVIAKRAAATAPPTP